MDEEIKHEQVEKVEVVQFSSDGAYYLVPRIGAEKFPQGGMIWLETAMHPLPVGQEWHTPNLFGAAIMRGRDYWRRFTRGRLLLGAQKSIAGGDVLIRDYIDAAWWTPGLEEAWAEADGLHEAIEEMRRMHGVEKAEPEAESGHEHESSGHKRKK
jgi:hypothetical protein